MLQLNLFESSSPLPSPPSASPIVGMKVQLQRACTCGSLIGVIGSSAGPHANRVTCDACNVFCQWLCQPEGGFPILLFPKVLFPHFSHLFSRCVVMCPP